MCIDSDLFGDVIITLDDVELYLMSLPKFGFGTPAKRLEQYIKNYPVASIIKSAKISGDFYKLDIANKSERIKSFDTVYVETPTEIFLRENPPCPTGFHTCIDLNCAFFKQRLKHEKNHANYMKRKAARKKGAKAWLN